MTIINTELLGNPVNWVIIWLILAVGAMLWSLLSPYQEQPPVSISLS